MVEYLPERRHSWANVGTTMFMEMAATGSVAAVADVGPLKEKNGDSMREMHLSDASGVVLPCFVHGARGRRNHFQYAQLELNGEDGSF